ncbi:MAG: nucleoid-associated protein YejK [Glaciecola sp.]|jgi:nucleoid-associated protein
MSAIIHHFVMHQLHINAEQRLAIKPRGTCFAVTPAIEALASEINQVFNAKPSKGVGGFTQKSAAEIAANHTQENTDVTVEVAEAAPVFADLLAQGIDDDVSFVQFSTAACQLLIKALVEDGAVETGFVVFSHYEYLATTYLFIGVINTKQHVEVNQDLELAYSDHLDVGKMRLAVRVDLTALATQAEQFRYISFIKGMMGRKVSDFFMRFIGCEEQVDTKQQNKQLLQYVDEYLATEQLDSQEKQATREVVSTYYKEKLAAGDDIQIAELAAALPKNEDRQSDFMAFNNASDAPLEPVFQPDKAAVRTLAKFSGAGGGVTLSFDRQLLGDKVHYDPVTDTLVIKGIPPNLKDQLMKA